MIRRGGGAWALTVAVLAGCGGTPATGSDAGAGDAGRPAECGPGLKPYRTACVPVLEDCPGDQVPIPGGGCKRIGVEECAIDGQPGLKGPPDWTCKRIGVAECEIDGQPGLKGPPDWTCQRIGVAECEIDGGPGLKGPPDWTCQRIGPPTACLAGWAKVKGGWCEPVVPSAACSAGTMELLGETSCQPIGDCGSGSYGLIALGPSTIFVDQSYAGRSSDGTQAHPYTTIGAAIAAAPAAGRIAVAAGTYAEDLIINKPLVLEGRCAGMVQLKGQGDEAAIKVTSFDVEVRGLGVSGPQKCVLVDGGIATIEQVAVEGCGGEGVVARKSATLTLRRARLSANSGRGVSVLGSKATLEKIAVRVTKPLLTDKTEGFGVTARFDQVASTLTLTDSLIDGNREAGVHVLGSAATVQRSLVRGTQPCASDQQLGNGIYVESATGQPASLTAADLVVASNHDCGVLLFGATASIDRAVARDTMASGAAVTPYGVPAVWGPGVWAEILNGQPSTVTLRDSLLIANVQNALGVMGSDATIERTVLRDTLTTSQGEAGIGVLAQPGEKRSPVVTLRRSLVQGNRGAGVVGTDSMLTVEASVVKDTVESAPPGLDGTGIEVARVEQASKLVVRDSLVSGNKTGGVAVLDATGRVERSVVRDTAPNPNGLIQGYGIAATFTTTAVPDLTVRDSLLARNHSAGVIVASARATLERVVVRDTLSCNETIACGVVAQSGSNFHPHKEASILAVRDCVMAGNAMAGLLVSGSEGTVERSIARDNLPGSNGLLGLGIGAASSREGSPSTLSLRDCLVTGNRGTGVGVWESSATIDGSAVTGTLPQQSDRRGGVGIQVMQSRPASILVRDSSVSGNRTAGIMLGGASGQLERTVIRDTSPQDADGKHGSGLMAQANEGQPAKLEARDCLVAENSGAGVIVAGSGATIERATIRDSRATTRGPGSGLVSVAFGQASKVQASGLLLLRNEGVGVGVLSSKATLSGCLIRDTRATAAGEVGDGIQVNPGEAAGGQPSGALPEAVLRLEDSLVDQSKRAGLVFNTASGAVYRSVIRNGIFAVNLENADPELGADNVFEGNTENQVSFGQGLQCSPPPAAPPPLPPPPKL